MSIIFAHKEDELLEAITLGQLERVKQLVSSGIAINTVLHSRCRQESTTLLGTAAYEGQTSVMEFLIDSKAAVNYKDPCFSRSALHWACVGGQVKAVQVLIAHNTDVNCSDRDSVTPLIRAVMFGRQDIVEMLIDNGANLSQVDRLHSSALHYASFDGRSGIVSALIRAGSISNNRVIYGQGTPLANLVYHGDFANCRLLLEAGYVLKEDSWILNYNCPNPKDKDGNIASYLIHEYRNPPSLSRLSRIVVRKAVGAITLKRKLCALPLPKTLLCALLLQE